MSELVHSREANRNSEAIWACFLAVTGTFEQLLTYVVFVGWSFYALAAGSIFVYRKT